MNLTIGNKTINSLDFLDTINKFRVEAGQSPIEPRKFIDKIEDELDDLSGKKFRTNTNQSKSSYYDLDKDQMMLVGMRESKAVRKKVLDYLKSLESSQEPQLPQSFSQALQLAADQAKQLEVAAPKIEFHDTVVNSVNTFSIRDAAKKINQRPIKFGEWLKSNGYMCLNGRAAQQYIDMGLLVTHTGVSESEHAYTQTRMTGKGCAYFANKLFEIKL